MRDICIQADKKIDEETGKAFKKDKNIQKGKNIAWGLILLQLFLGPSIVNVKMFPL